MYISGEMYITMYIVWSEVSVRVCHYFKKSTIPRVSILFGGLGELDTFHAIELLLKILSPF